MGPETAEDAAYVAELLDVAPVLTPEAVERLRAVIHPRAPRPAPQTPPPPRDAP